MHFVKIDATKVADCIFQNDHTFAVFDTAVDRRNHAPVDIVNIPLFTRFYTSQVVQDFFHQQYYKGNLSK